MGGDWHLVQHIPTSVAHLIHSLVFCAPPCRAVRRPRAPLYPHPGLSTSHTCAPGGRGSTAWPIPSTHGPEDSTPSDSALMRAIPASLHAPHSVPWSHNRPPPEPRHDEHEREVHAGLARGHCTAHGDCSRSRGRRIAHLRLVQLVPYLFLPPGKVTNSTRARAASRSWLLVSVVRSECSWPLRRPDPVGSTLFGRRVGVVPVARRPSRLAPLPCVAAHIPSIW